MTALTVTDFRKSIGKLTDRLLHAKAVLDDVNRSKRQLTINIQHLERLVSRVDLYSNFKPLANTKEEFNYTDEATDVLDTAAEYLIELRGFLDELEESETPAETNPPHTPHRPSSCNIKVTIPKFTGDYAAYPKFRSSFQIAMTADGKTKPEQLRVLEQQCEGRPATLIENLPPTDAGFDAAMKILNDTFNVKERQRQAILHKIRRMPQSTDELNSLRKTYEEMESLLRALESYEKIDDNEELRKIVMSKYSLLTLDRVSPNEIPTLKIMRERIQQIVRTKEDIDEVFKSLSITAPQLPHPPISIAAMQVDPKHTEKDPSLNKSKKRGNQSTAKTETESSTCLFCNRKNHVSENCRTFPDAAKRVEKLPANTCHICLSVGHIRRNCPSDAKCKICDSRYHHTALCPTKFGYFKQQTKSNEKPPVSATNDTKKKTIIALMQEIHNCYLTANAYICNPANGTRMRVRIFLDCGCPRTFILTKVAMAMEFSAIGTANLAIGVFLRQEVEEIATQKIRLQLLDPNTNEPHSITASTTPRITDKLGVTDIDEFRARYPQLQSLSLAAETEDEEITLLIGNDHLWKFILPEKKIELEENLYLINTLFGWMIVGSRENAQPSSNQVKSMHVSTKYLNALWSLEAIGISDTNFTAAQEEEMALQQFNATIRHVPTENRYEVGLPFRELQPKIPTNYGLAKAMLSSLIRKYSKRVEYLHTCNEIFRQQVQSGIIELAPTLQSHDVKQHYLPYHFVERPGKSTPIRVVYNGSAKTKNSNFSLNEVLYKGVNLLTDMIGVLLRFRLNSIAIISDIEKAFHQITIIPEHRDCLRFLWTEDYENYNDNAKILVYRFRRLPFGIISSSFILAATILYHLDQYKKQIVSQTAKRIRKDTYADNTITTFATIAEAIEFYQQATEIFNEAGMSLRQWHSNSPEVRKAIKPELRETNEQITILGLCWNTNTDIISLNIPELEYPVEETTMLTVLQVTSQIYDPLGFFAPITIRARIFLQQLHQEKYEWETPLSKERYYEWCAIFADLLDLKNFAFRRTFLESTEQVRSFQFHIFTDASIKAYAAIIYLRIQTNNKTTVQMLMAKSRVTPLKSDSKLSIPRLELMAALLGSRLISKITKTLDLEPKPCITHWIDNKAVINWISTDTALPLFVRNRVTEIKQVENVNYRYVRSQCNPSDLASRGISTENLHDQSSIWWHGPDWLTQDSSLWPSFSPDTDEKETDEMKPPDEECNVQSIYTEQHTSPFEIQVQGFLTYRALIRQTAFCVKFLRQHQTEGILRIFPNDEVSSISYATRLWIKSIQRNEFSDIVKRLEENRASNMIKKLRLFIDEEGIIRAAGRFHYAPLTYEEKNPVLLPKPLRNKVSWLIIQHIHEIKMHAGVAATLTAVRKRYWIPSGRKQVAAVLRKCSACKKHKAVPYKQPEESVLPQFRLNACCEPFSHIGLDIVGHFWVRREKMWILVVTCLVTRAVALEDLENLETETILLALRRIQARWTKAVFYLADNAPQFHLIKSIMDQSASEEFTWKFIPAFMPWAGGSYERLMKTIKSSLDATFRVEINVSTTQFRTIIQEIAGVMNQRPLTFLGEEFNGPPLTPNDILKIQFAPFDIETIVTNSDTAVAAYLKHSMKANREVVKHFWNIWSHEYLQFLRERSATMSFRKKTKLLEPRIGDVVLLHDPIIKQRNWHLGVIYQLQRSEDNSVRSAVVRLRFKRTGSEVKQITVVRPVEKLYYMELNEFEDQGEEIPTGDKIEDGNSYGIENIPIESEPEVRN